MEIHWLEARQKTVARDKEVKVSIYSTGKSKNTQVTFYNGSAAKITNGEKISVGIAGHRMYFKSGGMFTLRGYSAKNAKCVRIPGAKEDLVGEYNLAFDADNKCWYVGY